MNRYIDPENNDAEIIECSEDEEGEFMIPIMDSINAVHKLIWSTEDKKNELDQAVKTAKEMIDNLLGNADYVTFVNEETGEATRLLRNGEVIEPYTHTVIFSSPLEIPY